MVVSGMDVNKCYSAETVNQVNKQKMKDLRYKTLTRHKLISESRIYI